MKRDRDKQFQGSLAGLFGVLTISALLLVIGGTQLFYPRFRLEYFVYMIGGILCVSGVWMAASYFSRQLYRRLSSYDFSLGILFLISGILVIVRAFEIIKHMPLMLGMLCMLIGVILLQNALQVRILKGKIWGFLLVFSLLTVGAAVLMILNPARILFTYETVLYGVLSAVGAGALIVQLIAAFFTHRLKKDEDRKQDRNMEELDEIDRTPEETVIVSPADVFHRPGGPVPALVSEPAAAPAFSSEPAAAPALSWESEGPSEPAAEPENVPSESPAEPAAEEKLPETDA